MKLLVTGGAGYIGSVTVKHLLEQGHEVVVYDNLSFGHKEAVHCPLIVGDLLDYEKLESVFLSEKFDAVIHFAAFALAGESMKDPYACFRTNTQGGLNLLEAMRKNNVKHIVFSSTCALYGTPDQLPVSEDNPKHPESVYGESKLMVESMLSWYETIYGIKHINLRYFNAAGAAMDGAVGEDHDPETHIIPLAIGVAMGKQPFFSLFGTNYDTPDGTCIRDYVHVEDLAIAHSKALEKLHETDTSDYFNIGTGKGYSNREILEMIEKVSGKKIPIQEKPRRAGDPPRIYADNKKVREILGLTLENSSLENIIKTAWAWHNRANRTS